MIKQIKSRITALVQANLKGYLLLCVFFLGGLFFSLAVTAKHLPEEEIRLYLHDFLLNTKNAGYDSGGTFYLSLMQYGKLALLLFFSSLTVIGVPIILLRMAIFGFSYGTVLLCLFRVFGIKALLILLTAILPHIIIGAPCCLVYSFYCMKNAHQIFRGNIDFKSEIIIPFLFGLIFMTLTAVAALIQAYIEPFLIGLFASHFI